MSTIFGVSSPDLVEIMHDIRVQLSTKGQHSFRQLTQAFAINDKSNKHSFDIDTFVAILGRCGIFLKQQSATRLFRYFARNDSVINYYEFLQSLQGTISQKRFELISFIFDALDKSHIGSLSFATVAQAFDASQHPEALSGKKSTETVRSEFVQAFDGAGSDITRDVFIDYYAGISAATPLDDDYFCTMLERCFHISQPRSNQRKQLLDSVRAILRERIRQRSDNGNNGPRTESEKLRILLKWWDLQGTGYVNYEQFHGALQRFGLVLDDRTVRALFDEFDYSHTGSINYSEFVAVLYEEDIVSVYWSQRQLKHRESQQEQKQQSEEKRQYAINDSVILAMPSTRTNTVSLTNNDSDSDSQRRATAVFVLGGPGSGKGTQCERIVKEFGFEHLSTGDLLRVEQSEPNSQYGTLINACITEGKLVPVDLIVKLLEQAILKGIKAGKYNYLVDGFPRAVDQIGEWDRIMGPHRIRVPFVLYFDVPLDVLEQRLLARGQTSGRADDNIESIKKRFLTFEKESQPVVGHFANEGRVRVIDGTQKPEDVYEVVRKNLNTLQLKPLAL